MEHEDIIQRLTSLEANQNNMKEDIVEIKKDLSDTNRKINDMSISIIRLEDNVNKLCDGLASINDLKKEVQEIRESGKISIMSDIIKPICISACTAVITVLFTFFK